MRRSKRLALGWLLLSFSLAAGCGQQHSTPFAPQSLEGDTVTCTFEVMTHARFDRIEQSISHDVQCFDEQRILGRC